MWIPGVSDSVVKLVVAIPERPEAALDGTPDRADHSGNYAGHDSLRGPTGDDQRGAGATPERRVRYLA